MHKGFTLLELIIVIVIVGILGTLGFTQYVKVVEKGRTAEARSVLGAIRNAQKAYELEHGVGSFTTDINDLVVIVPTACTTTHYFSYSLGSAGEGVATRSATGGKQPNHAAYKIKLYLNGTWGGDPGYY